MKADLFEKSETNNIIKRLEQNYNEPLFLWELLRHTNLHTQNYRE